MKPTREQALQIAREAGLDVRGGDILPHYRGSNSEGYFRLVAAAYEAGVEKGKADYEREHLRHTVPLPDALVAMQNQVAEACAKVCDDLADCEENTDAYRAGAHWCREIIRSAEWRKYMEGK
jgi:hypothetical protein